MKTAKRVRQHPLTGALKAAQATIALLETQNAELKLDLKQTLDQLDRERVSWEGRIQAMSTENTDVRTDVYEVRRAFDQLRESIGLLYEGAAQRRRTMFVRSDDRFRRTFGNGAPPIDQVQNQSPVDDAREQPQ